MEHLRRSRTMRRSRHYTQKREGHGRITDTVSSISAGHEALLGENPSLARSVILCSETRYV